MTSALCTRNTERHTEQLGKMTHSPALTSDRLHLRVSVVGVCAFVWVSRAPGCRVSSLGSRLEAALD